MNGTSNPSDKEIEDGNKTEVNSPPKPKVAQSPKKKIEAIEITSPTKKNAGWPSPRYNSKGIQKPNQKGRRFVVAPSQFLKAPKENLPVLNFYAAPFRLPITASNKSKPILNIISKEDTETGLTTPKPSSPLNIKSTDAEGTSGEYVDDIFYSNGKSVVTVTTSPSMMKSKIASAVAEATANAQNGIIKTR